MRKILFTSITATTLALGLVTSANAATAPKANASCTASGASTTINKVKYVCQKNLGGKLVWMLPAPSSLTSSKPSIGGQGNQNGGGDDRGGFGDRHPSDEGSAADVARHAAMQKYADCLTKNGVTSLPFRGGPDDQNRTQPTLSAQQKKAMTACASLAPQFGPGFGGRGGDDNRGGSAPQIPSATKTSTPSVRA